MFLLTNCIICKSFTKPQNSSLTCHPQQATILVIIKLLQVRLRLDIFLALKSGLPLLLAQRRSVAPVDGSFGAFSQPRHNFWITHVLSVLLLCKLPVNSLSSGNIGPDLLVFVPDSVLVEDCQLTKPVAPTEVCRSMLTEHVVLGEVSGGSATMQKIVVNIGWKESFHGQVLFLTNLNRDFNFWTWIGKNKKYKIQQTR